MSPAGSRSVTWTPVALLGPWLVAVIVKVTSLPRLGVGLSAALVMAMSAATGVMVALAELLALTGSARSSADLVAVLVIAAVTVTVAMIMRVALAPLVKGPMFQTPVPEL